jgi:ribosomal protein S12 methylthiotransferase
VDTLLDMARRRANGRCEKLVAAGCLSQRYAADLGEEIEELDNLLGTDRLERFGDVLRNTAERIVVGSAAHFLQKPDTPRFIEPGSASAYVKIGDGCSRKCSFCAIPAIRGRARSRPLNQIVAEARKLAQNGVKEINLVAQDTSSYGRDLRDGSDLVKLLIALNEVPGILWIRLLYLYPDSVSDDLLTAMRDLPKVAPYLDVPIQHASAKILRRMRRGHGPKSLFDLVNRVRKTIPKAFIRTSILVGHPGETDDDFAELMEFVRLARFNHLGVFRYSAEEGTASAGAGRIVSKRVSYQRSRKVMALQRRISREHNRNLKGECLQVLLEGLADEQGYVLWGRHIGQAPQIDGNTYVTSCDAKLGNVIDARVVETGDFDVVVQSEQKWKQKDLNFI